MTDKSLTRREILTGGVTLLTATVLGALPDFQDTAFAQSDNMVGRKAPELIGTSKTFLNTDGKVLRLYGKGGLLETGSGVLIDFWEYTCVNCARTLPYLKAWNERYAKSGLTIIGIHSPEFQFAKSDENVLRSVKQYGLTYPILLDDDFLNWNAFENSYWPRKYLMDSTGKIVYDHAGEGGYGETEQAIQKVIKARRPGVVLPPIMEALRGSDKPGAVCYPQTREIYCGYWRGDEYFGSPEGVQRDKESEYRDGMAGKRRDGVFYARGSWKVKSESIQHARTSGTPFGDYIALPYRALEVNAVIKPEGKPFDLFIEQDGKPLVKGDHGADVSFTTDGRSFVRVTTPRMYSLVKNRKWGKHELRLGTISPDFGLYSFTFSSCTVDGDS